MADNHDCAPSVLVEFVVIEASESTAVRRRQIAAVRALLRWIVDGDAGEDEQSE